MTRRARICPACHRPFPPKLIVRGPVRQRIVGLISIRPDGITPRRDYRNGVPALMAEPTKQCDRAVAGLLDGLNAIEALLRVSR